MSALLVFAYCVSHVFANNNTRNYTVGIKVSTLWFSGSADTMYFQLCNDDLVITNGSTVQDPCLKWYEMSGGMANRGDWYYFDYPHQPDIGSISSMKLLSQLNDQFCLSKVSIDGEVYDDTNVDCVEVAEGKPDGSCSVIDIIFATAPTAQFTGTLYEGSECPYDVSSDTYTGPPVTTANGTRTYEISLTVSNVFFSGTSNDLYLRLCTNKGADCTKACDAAMTNCDADDWFVFVGGVRAEGDTYKGYWNTKDIGNVHYADIVIFGADQFCLSRLVVDTATADATTAECISDDSKDGCATLSIDLDNAVFTTSSVDQCGYGIMNNDTFIGVDQYIFTFKTGATLFCGADSTIFFIFCAVDGGTANTEYCSDIFEIGGRMPDTETDYTFSIDITQYPVFNTLSDVYFVDVWEYETENWCLSDITINGKTEDGSIVNGPNADSTPALNMESPVNDGVYCNGARVYMQSNEWSEFVDGPVKKYKIKKCRWNDLKSEEGTVKVSKTNESQDWLDWMNSGYNWVYICAVLIGIMVCCIVGCACCQSMRKKQSDEVKDSNRPWHGGNSAFYS